jgi:hypothetical protein
VFLLECAWETPEKLSGLPFNIIEKLSIFPRWSKRHYITKKE